MRYIMLILLLATLVAAYPQAQGYVNDFADILNPEEEKGLETLISTIEKNTSAEIAVVTIESLEDSTIELYAVELFEEWGIGKKDKDNGLLILIAPNERKYRIEVGYGLEGVLPDGKAGRIARENFVEAFRAGEYGAGIIGAVNDIKKVLGGEALPYAEQPRKRGIAGALLNGLALIFFGMLIFGRLIKDKKKRFKTQGIVGLLLFGLSWFFLGIGIAIIVLVLFSFFSAITYIPLGGGGFYGGYYGFGGGYRSGGFGGGFGGGFSGGGGVSGGW